MKVEIRITNDNGEFVVVKTQPFTRPGVPAKTQSEVLAAAVSDARTWLRRNT